MSPRERSALTRLDPAPPMWRSTAIELAVSGSSAQPATWIVPSPPLAESILPIGGPLGKGKGTGTGADESLIAGPAQPVFGAQSLDDSPTSSNAMNAFQRACVGLPMHDGANEPT